MSFGEIALSVTVTSKTCARVLSAWPRGWPRAGVIAKRSVARVFPIMAFAILRQARGTPRQGKARERKVASRVHRLAVRPGVPQLSLRAAIAPSRVALRSAEAVPL